MTEPPVVPEGTIPVARFVGLVRDGDQVGARIEYARPGGAHSAIVFHDTDSLILHIADLVREARDTAEEHAALSAMITEAGKKR
jgi:hypothetical protein